MGQTKGKGKGSRELDSVQGAYIGTDCRIAAGIVRA